MSLEAVPTRATPRDDVATFLFAARALESELNYRLTKRTGLPFLEYQILAHVIEAGGAIYMTDLAVALAMSKSRVSHAISRMESRRWVHRYDCTDDGRRIYTATTSEGRDVHEQAAPVYAELCRELALDRLSPDEAARLAATSSVLLRDPQALVPYQRTMEGR